MPQTKRVSWLTLSRQTKNQTRKNVNKKENSVITKFKKMLESNPVENQYMNTMITSIPRKYKSKNPPKSLDQLFQQLNNVLTVAPEFNKTALVGTPLSAI